MSRIHRLAVAGTVFTILWCAPSTAQPAVRPAGPEIVVAGDAEAATLDVFDDGGYVVAWREPDGVTLKARLYGADDLPRGDFSPAGVPRGGDARVHEDADFAQFAPAVTATGFGYLVVWTDWSYSPDFDGAIAGRRFRADGTPLDRQVLLSPAAPPANRDGAVAAGAADGSFVVLWTATCSFSECSADDPHGPDGSLAGVFGRALGPLGEPAGGEIGVPVETTGSQRAMAVRPVSPSAYRALWLSQPAGGGPVRVVVRRLESSLCAGLCLGGGRFELQAWWEDGRGGSGPATPVYRGDRWGTFWFYNPANVDLAVKVLDGLAINGHVWVFRASLSDATYQLNVADKLTGESYSYFSAAGGFDSGAETTVLPSPVPPPWSPSPAAPPRTDPAPCRGDELCLGGGRFAVEVEWASGKGIGTPLSATSGWFWFFRPDNPEVLVKVLDGRPVNGHHWVFFASLSNLGFDLRVTDRTSGETVTYRNPVRRFASFADTLAFPAP